MAASTTQNLSRRSHIIMGTMEGRTTTSIMVMTIMVAMVNTRIRTTMGTTTVRIITIIQERRTLAT